MKAFISRIANSDKSQENQKGLWVEKIIACNFCFDQD